MKAGARYAGSVVLRTNVESWADSETDSRNSNEPATEITRSRMAGSPSLTRRSRRVARSELVAQRHHQRPRQNRPREEQAARATVREEAQTRVPLFKTLRLIDVEHVGANRDAAFRDEVLGSEVEIGVGRQLV